VIVEDEQHGLVGLVSHRSLLRYLAERNADREQTDPVPVREIMVRNPVSVSPEMSTLDAIELMRERQIGALPVVREGQLVGIVTERDFIEIAGRLLDDSLTTAGAQGGIQGGSEAEGEEGSLAAGAPPASAE
jgi:predicted transcriptional regulator